MLDPDFFLAGHDLFRGDGPLQQCGRVSRWRRCLWVLVRGIHAKAIRGIRVGEGTGGNSLMSLTLANALLGYSDIDTRYQPCGEKTLDLEDFPPWHASESRQPALRLPI